MNKYGETIVLKVNKDKCLAGFYALGFEPKERRLYCYWRGWRALGYRSRHI